MLGFVFAPHAEAHVTVEDDEDEFGLGEVVQVRGDGSEDRKDESRKEFRPLGLLWRAAVEKLHGVAKDECGSHADDDLDEDHSELGPDALATFVSTTWGLVETNSQEHTEQGDSNDIIET